MSRIPNIFDEEFPYWDPRFDPQGSRNRVLFPLDNGVPFNGAYSVLNRSPEENPTWYWDSHLDNQGVFNWALSSLLPGDRVPFNGAYSVLNRFPEENPTSAHTEVDWKETPEAYVFVADLPWLKKEDVKVEIKDSSVLQISGESGVDPGDPVERRIGKFSMRFTLLENVKLEQIKASMENGVLTVTAPKVEVKKPDIKAIEISG